MSKNFHAIMPSSPLQSLKVLSNKKGFTLLEVVIAMTLTSIVMVIIAMGLSLTIRSWEKGEETIQADQKARIILGKLSKEIASMYPYRYKPIENISNMTPDNMARKPILALIGETNRFDFISTLPLSDPEQKSFELKMISFRLETIDENTGESLVLREKNLNPGKPLEGTDEDDEIFSDSIENLVFRYFVVNEGKDLQNREITQPGEWLTSFKEEEEKNLDQPLEDTFIGKPFLRAVEVTLSLYEIGEEGDLDYDKIMNYPPLVIPLNVGKKIKLAPDEL